MEGKRGVRSTGLNLICIYIYIFTIMCIYIYSYVSVISVYHILSVYLSICISEYQFEESEAQ